MISTADLLGPFGGSEAFFDGVATLTKVNDLCFLPVLLFLLLLRTIAALVLLVAVSKECVSGRVSMISLLSRRKLWITFARLLEEHVGTDALSERGISSAMVACARIDVVTAREAFSEFNMCLKNWLRPMNKAAAEGEVHTHRCATSANVSKLLGLFIVGEHLNAGDYESDNGLSRPVISTKIRVELWVCARNT